MTDLPSVLPLLERNICVNKDVWSNAGGKVNARELSWGETKTEIHPPSLLLLADCVYYTEVLACSELWNIGFLKVIVFF